MPTSDDSRTRFGLKAEDQMLDLSAPMGAEPDSDLPTSFVELTHRGRQWRIERGAESLVDPDGFDWFRLKDYPRATRVKKNSQRDVWCVQTEQGAFFAKHYHPRGLVHRLKRLIRGPVSTLEWNVGLYARAHAIAAVEPVAIAWEADQSSKSLLITRAVAEALPLSECWVSIRDDRWSANLLTQSLARLIARAHQCGFQHGDMHPGNILVRRVGRRYEAVFVDLHRVRVARPVPPHRAIRNLAQLNQWFRRNATYSQRLRFLNAYIDYRDQFAQASPLARNWRVDRRRLVEELAEQADRHANWLWSKRDRRTMRTSRYFARIAPAAGWRGHALLQSKHPSPTMGDKCFTFTEAQWTRWLADPLAWVDPARHELLKDSHTAMICKGRLPNGSGGIAVVAKRPLARNALKRLAQVFGRSRNMRSWRMANMMRNRELPAAQPLAVVERFAAGIIRTDSVSLTEFIEDACDLETFLAREVARIDPAAQRDVKNRLIEAVVRLLKAFGDRGFVHRDMKAPNLMVRWSAPYEGRPVLTFIDMDGISHRRRATDVQHMRAVVRLCASLVSSPACTCSDRLRFLKSYLSGPGKSSAGWKDTWRRIHDEVCSKLQHKDQRRQWKLANYGRE